MAGKLKHWRTETISYAPDKAFTVIHRSTVSPSRELTYNASSWAVLGATRFGLALIVFLSHMMWFSPHNAILQHVSMLGGKAAVLGFFLISGASIGHSYRDRPDGFYRRRFLRIYPLYFVAAIFSETLCLIYPGGIVCPAMAFPTAGIKTGIANLFLLQEFIAIPINYNLPLWTLSIEVFLYLLTPRFALWSEKIIIGLIVISMVTFHFQYILGSCLGGFPVMVFGWPWLIGFLLIRSTDRRIPLVLGIVGAFLVFVNKGITVQPLSTVTYLSVLFLLVAVPYASLPGYVRTLADWLGDISYPLYLFHAPLALMAFAWLGFHRLFDFLVFIFLTVVALYYLVDVYWKKIFWKPLVNYSVAQFAKRRPASFAAAKS